MQGGEGGAWGGGMKAFAVVGRGEGGGGLIGMMKAQLLQGIMKAHLLQGMGRFVVLMLWHYQGCAKVWQGGG